MTILSQLFTFEGVLIAFCAATTPILLALIWVEIAEGWQHGEAGDHE